MASIMKLANEKKNKLAKVEEHKRRSASEEAQRIKDKLQYHDEKLSKSNARNRECLTMK